MRTATTRMMLAGVLCLAATVGAAPAAAVPTATATAVAAAPYCGITWGSGAKTAGTLSTAPLVKVVTSRAGCWDRTVFEFDGAVRGYSVAYATSITTEGRGLELVPYVAGGDRLGVSLRAPALAPAYPARPGDHAANVLAYRTLRDVVYGGSFEGYSTFAVGVRARLPFRVLIAPGPGTHSQIIMDVAHLW
jgi:hypothetical protein